MNSPTQTNAPCRWATVYVEMSAPDLSRTTEGHGDQGRATYLNRVRPRF
jgi:hypothetical protein